MTRAFDGRLDARLAAEMKAAGMEYGLSIGRRAPLHKMHVDCILEIARAGLKPVVVIGSTNAAGDALYDPLRNPLTQAEQVRQLRDALPPEVYARCEILTLADEEDDAAWLGALKKLLAERGMAGKTVMHFRAKAADAAAAREKSNCKPLGAYAQSLMAAGIAVWQSYNADPAEDGINASDIRSYDLAHLTADQHAAAPHLHNLARRVRAVRGGNPDGTLLDDAGIALTMLDCTLDRLYREAGVRTRAILERAKLMGTVSLASLTAATKETVERLKRAPLVVSPHAAAAYAAQGFDAIPVRLGTYQSGEEFCVFFDGDGDNFEKNADRIRDAHVFVVQSTAAPVGANVQHLLQMVHTLKRQGAARVTVALPFAAYARQDRAFARRFVAVGADLLPVQLKAAGADGVIGVALHSKAAMAFYAAAFGPAFTALSTAPLLAAHLKTLGIEADTAVFGAPDGGEKPDDEGIARAADVGRALSARFNEAAMFRISKEHTADSATRITAFSGDVRGKTAVVVDDMADGGTTLINAARALKNHGAKEVVCCVTHGVLTGGERPALEKLLTAQAQDGGPLIARFVVTDSVPDVAAKVAALPPALRGRVDVLALAPYLGQHLQAQHRARFAQRGKGQ